MPAVDVYPRRHFRPVYDEFIQIVPDFDKNYSQFAKQPGTLQSQNRKSIQLWTHKNQYHPEHKNSDTQVAIFRSMRYRHRYSLATMRQHGHSLIQLGLTIKVVLSASA
jgi:hypothetical protein